MFINYKREIYALAHFNLSTASFKCLNAFDVLCAQLTRVLLAIAKFLFILPSVKLARSFRTPYFLNLDTNCPSP